MVKRMSCIVIAALFLSMVSYVISFFIFGQLFEFSKLDIDDFIILVIIIVMGWLPIFLF